MKSQYRNLLVKIISEHHLYLRYVRDTFWVTNKEDVRNMSNNGIKKITMINLSLSGYMDPKCYSSFHRYRGNNLSVN